MGAAPRQRDRVDVTAQDAAATPDSGENPWASIVGPCYTVDSFARELGWDTDAAAAAASDLRILEIRTSDGVVLYPAFQVVDGRVVSGLDEVLPVLHSGLADPWTWAQWLTLLSRSRTGQSGVGGSTGSTATLTVSCSKPTTTQQPGERDVTAHQAHRIDASE